MRLSYQHHIPESFKDLVLDMEQNVLHGRLPDKEALDRLPEHAVFGSPLLLQAGSVRLILDGRLQEAQEWLRAAIKGFALQSDDLEMLSMIGLLTLLNVRIGDFHETETLLQFLEEETLRNGEGCSGFVWWALARGRCWSRTAPILQSRSTDEYFAKAADRFREAGDDTWFAYLLLDRWLYGEDGMRDGEWARRIGELRRRAALHTESRAVLSIIGGAEPTKEVLARLPSRYAYMVSMISWQGAETAGPPLSDLRYDVEVQLFASQVHAARKLASGDRTDAALSLRQMELLLEEMSTPRTAAWLERLKELTGAAAAYVPPIAPLSVHDDGLLAAPEPRQGRLRIQLMSGMRLFGTDGAVVSPKWKRRKSRELLVFLLLQPDYRALRDQVVEQLFGEGEASKLANHLYVSLHELRNALADVGFDDAIEVRGGVIGFRESVIEVVDVEQYMTLSRVGDQLWAYDKEPAAMLYMDAVRLYGLLGADMPQVDWIERWRSQLLERQTLMLRRLGEYYAGLTDDSHTEQWLSAWIELRPDQEEAYQAMIRYWKQRGRHAEAVGWYKRLERMCSEEFGTEPLEETKRLVWGV
ncbi:hypothetical protein BG53_00715 [Paenibacillus darwinianus]|uniref:Bacterial transcriptional activator domain-containing protein n=2 Tax=Paenibacillus darwinianus TaxID=1380763 RepID=A0A9W5W789_9BACL|nr:hypothetical protein CH50_03645 [Paenibacillus darwinianus]EXX89066.1 hypothetical protein BG53_00715 [Paenibacillus darwinianus]EXX89341.1 hypothetical protein BG52_15675 [Paenibacillus darwinianus]